MTDKTHPITPPPELVEQWRDLPEYADGRRKMIMVTFSKEKLLDIATQAARWGADQELEACCEVLRQKGVPAWSMLRSNRRPKPPSLKERALAALNEIEDKMLGPTVEEKLIRRALEQLND